TNSLPIWTIVDVLYVYSWLLIALGLLINLFFTVQFIEICVNIFTFFLLLLAIMLDFKQQGIHHADYIVHEILVARSEEHTSELQSRFDLVCRLLLEQK